MTASEHAVETFGLVKQFGNVRAVDGVDLAIRAGCVYGLLGPNGAGKTTTIRILSTLLRPDAGKALVLGHDVVREGAALRRRISLTGQFASVDDDLTGVENLTLQSRLLGYSRRDARRRAHALLEGFGLAEAGGRQVKTYSGGMRRRLDLALGMVTMPELLFLDEPTTGLDPQSRIQVWQIVRSLVEQGATVLLTTQYLEEADRLADRIAVIDHGAVIAEGTPGQLKASIGAGVLHVRVDEAADRTRAGALLAESVGSAVNYEVDPHALSARVSQPAGAARALVELSRAGIGTASFALAQPSLDEVFLNLTGQPGKTADAVA